MSVSKLESSEISVVFVEVHGIIYKFSSVLWTWLGLSEPDLFNSVLSFNLRYHSLVSNKFRNAYYIRYQFFSLQIDSRFKFTVCASHGYYHNGLQS